MLDGEKWTGEDPDYVVVEEYRHPDTEPDPQLRGNPMAMVFPAPMEDRQLHLRLEVLPQPFPANWREWPLAARRGLIAAINECHYVFGTDYDLFNKVLALLRNSLRKRDPRDARVMRAIMQLAAGKMVSVPRFGSVGAGGGLGLLVMGISGVGKSSSLDRTAKVLGQFGRIHQQLNGKPVRWPQLGIVRVNVGDTWKDTLRRILTEANRQLGRELHHAPSRATTAALAQRVRAALSMGWAPVLMIDEIQRLARIDKYVAKEILNGAIDLMSCEGIPVVLVGNEMVRRLFSLHKSELAKFSNGGRLHYAALGEYDEDTVNFISFLKKYSVSLSPIKYSCDFDHMLWVHTMGIRRIMVEYMRCVLERHADNEGVKVNSALLQDISENEMIEFELALSIIRRLELGHELGYAEAQEYEEFLDSAIRNRERTNAQKILAHEWTSSAKSAGQATMSAKSFLKEREKLHQRESAEHLQPQAEPEIVDTDAAARLTHDQLPDGALGASLRQEAQDAARKQTKRRMDKVKQNLDGRVVSLDERRRRLKGAEEGVDPGDIR